MIFRWSAGIKLVLDFYFRGAAARRRAGFIKTGAIPPSFGAAPVFIFNRKLYFLLNIKTFCGMHIYAPQKLPLKRPSPAGGAVHVTLWTEIFIFLAKNFEIEYIV